MPLPLELDEEHATILENIKTKLRPGMKLLFASVTGSRAKKMNSPGSDFDCLCIVILPKGEYLLQRPIRSEKYIYDDELEGNFIDVLTAYEYAITNNPMIYEVFGGIPLYKTQAALDIETLFKSVYQPSKLLVARSGMLLGYKVKKLIKNKDDPNVTTCKLACESVYLALLIFYLVENKTSPPPFDVFKILAGITRLTVPQKKMIMQLI